MSSNEVQKLIDTFSRDPETTQVAYLLSKPYASSERWLRSEMLIDCHEVSSEWNEYHRSGDFQQALQHDSGAFLARCPPENTNLFPLKRPENDARCVTMWQVHHRGSYIELKAPSKALANATDTKPITFTTDPPDDVARCVECALRYMEEYVAQKYAKLPGPTVQDVVTGEQQIPGSQNAPCHKKILCLEEFSIFTPSTNPDGYNRVVYNHVGAPVAWFVVGPKYSKDFRVAFDRMGRVTTQCDRSVNHQHRWPSTAWLIGTAIPFYVALQHAGQYFSFSGSATVWGFSLGRSILETVAVFGNHEYRPIDCNPACDAASDREPPFEAVAAHSHSSLETTARLALSMDTELFSDLPASFADASDLFTEQPEHPMTLFADENPSTFDESGLIYAPSPSTSSMPVPNPVREALPTPPSSVPAQRAPKRFATLRPAQASSNALSRRSSQRDSDDESAAAAAGSAAKRPRTHRAAGIEQNRQATPNELAVNEAVNEALFDETSYLTRVANEMKGIAKDEHKTFGLPQIHSVVDMRRLHQAGYVMWSVASRKAITQLKYAMAAYRRNLEVKFDLSEKSLVELFRQMKNVRDQGKYLKIVEVCGRFSMIEKLPADTMLPPNSISSWLEYDRQLNWDMFELDSKELKELKEMIKAGLQYKRLKDEFGLGILGLIPEKSTWDARKLISSRVFSGPLAEYCIESWRGLRKQVASLSRDASEIVKAMIEGSELAEYKLDRLDVDNVSYRQLVKQAFKSTDDASGEDDSDGEGDGEDDSEGEGEGGSGDREADDSEDSKDSKDSDEDDNGEDSDEEDDGESSGESSS